MGRTPIDIRVDERADAELSGVQDIGFLQCDGYVTEGLPTLLVQILPDHGGQRCGDPHFVLTDVLVITLSELHGVAIGRDGQPALVLEMVRRLVLQGVRDLGRMD
jgi:hypothetical protein